MKIYQAQVNVTAEIHAASGNEAARRRERLVETLNRLLSGSPALHALGVMHFRVNLLDTFREKPDPGSLADALNQSDAQMTPTGLPQADRHGQVMQEADRAVDDTPAHYPDAGASTRTG